MDAFHNTSGYPCQQASRCQPDKDLGKNRPDNLGKGHRTAHGREHNNGQHIGKGIVAAAFDFQHGSRTIFQIEPLGTENGKYRSGIGRT